MDDDFFNRGFTGETDPFDRVELAERLTHLFKELDHGTVSILHGRWGTGKSVFARQWARHLETSGTPSIYFDAFASDYISDPFQAVSSAFISAAAMARKRDDEAYKRFLSAAAKVGKRIGASSAKIGAKIVTLGVIGAAELEDFSEIGTALSDSLGDISEEAVKELLEDHAGDEAIFGELRKSLAALPSLLNQEDQGDEGSQAPSLVIIIDELDRCRPDFALGILEVLKHFFRSERVHFVLVTNRDHLLHSVQQRYGVGDFAEEYIQKFYDFLIHFEGKVQEHKGSAGKIYAGNLIAKLLPAHVPTSEKQSLKRYLEEIAFAYDLTLRQVESVVTNTLMAYLSIRQDELRPGIIIAFLAALKTKDPDLYRMAKVNGLSFEAFTRFLDGANWSEGFALDRIMKIFQYHLDENINLHDGEWDSFAGGGASSMGFFDRLEVLPYVCNSLLDRFGKL